MLMRAVSDCKNNRGVLFLLVTDGILVHHTFKNAQSKLVNYHHNGVLANHTSISGKKGVL